MAAPPSAHEGSCQLTHPCRDSPLSLLENKNKKKHMSHLFLAVKMLHQAESVSADTPVTVAVEFAFRSPRRSSSSSIVLAATGCCCVCNALP